MDIKEIAMKVARKVDPDFQGLPSDRAACEFAESLIESYKAELLKEVGGPVVIYEPDYHYEAMGCGLEDRNITDRYDAMQHGWDCAISRMLEQIPEGDLYTSDQLAAAILKATKPLEERRCEICGYAEHHREHTSCLRTQLAAAQEENGRLENQVLARDAELWGRTQEILGLKDQLAKAEQRYLAWEGGEEWEQLAFQLCADECGEESCNELIWEGSPPEPWAIAG